jgi:hypothetical protein
VAWQELQRRCRSGALERMPLSRAAGQDRRSGTYWIAPPSEESRMTEETRQTPANPPDASDVVEGPVGSASIKDPATSGPMGADLDQLPTIDPGDAIDDERGSSKHERQDPDHVGVDWDVTAPPRD